MIQKLVCFIILFINLMICQSLLAESLWDKYNQEIAKRKQQEIASVIKKQMKVVRSTDEEYGLYKTALSYYLQGDYNESIVTYKKLMDINPLALDVNLAITLPLMVQKRWREVRRYAERVISIAPWNYIAHIRLMMAEEAMRDWQALMSHSKQVAIRYPSQSGVFVYMARAAMWQGDVRAAREAYSQVLVRIPAHIEANRYVNKHAEIKDEKNFLNLKIN
ncbi:MAG: tetratricopeptide repeat protein [Methylococcales bacterium]|jgi:tetratricopeptide (TPR) repeat protein|nr:tetratricopeptide repeat protein [Methylococcales bacterium]MBT7409770.1 tetratricopeptide repeat protein [Methylococcales bacterium]